MKPDIDKRMKLVINLHSTICNRSTKLMIPYCKTMKYIFADELSAPNWLLDIGFGYWLFYKCLLLQGYRSYHTFFTKQNYAR